MTGLEPALFSVALSFRDGGIMADSVQVIPVAHIYPEGCAFGSIEDIKGKTVVVMGLGLNGGGEASVRFLLKNGANVIATDMKTEEELKPTIDSIAADSSLDKSRLVYHLGGHSIEDFENADCVIKNPGVKYDGNKFLAAAKAIETDISLFLHFSKAPIIAVTGSKGKSSTVSAIHYGLREAGFDAFLGGNITVSPLSFIDKTSEKTPVVLELSSWQLADLRGRKLLRPKISVITKIVPDHQNFYHSMIAYVADKKLIYAEQTKKDFAIFDFDDDAAADGGTLIENWGNIFAREAKARVLRYSRKALPKNVDGVWLDKNGRGKCRIGGTEETILRDLVVPGKHIRTNCLNAALVLRLMGVEAKKIAEIIGKWNGIEHRLEFFHEYKANGRSFRFYNDSAATVPEATAAASQSFDAPVILIAGGTDKGLDLSPIPLALSSPSAVRPEAIYLLEGSATDKLLPLLSAEKIAVRGVYPSLDALLSALKSDIAGNAACGTERGIVVFSPGATSFGMFRNEFDRGNSFKDAVRRIFAGE